jgi:centromere protein C
VYGDGDAEVGQRFPLSTIKEIIRTEERESAQRKHGKKGAKKKRKPKKNRDDLSEDDTVDNSEPWETQGGVVYGPVKKWDSETQTATHEEEIMGA